MTEVILTRGLPASGKSTWAKAWVAADPSSRVRVNRDDIRFQLYGSYWGEGVDENVVSKVEEAMVKAAVDAGKSVVIDATHLAARYITRWRRLYPHVIVQSFQVPLAELNERNLLRVGAGERGVDPVVIYRMAERFQIKADGKLPPLPEPTPPQTWKPAPAWSSSLRDAYIFDIDGTVANHTDVRGPYDTSRYHLDTVHQDVACLALDLYTTGHQIIYVSGRDEEFRDVTQQWLWKNVIDADLPLFMRPKGDVRNDAIVKHELFHQNIANRWNVVGVFDDRGRVLRMWRAIGLTTFAVGDTDNYNF